MHLPLRIKCFPQRGFCSRNAFLNNGTTLLTQRRTVEWSTSTPRSAIHADRERNGRFLGRSRRLNGRPAARLNDASWPNPEIRGPIDDRDPWLKAELPWTTRLRHFSFCWVDDSNRAHIGHLKRNRLACASFNLPLRTGPPHR